jgi:hypothetical protein
MPALFDQLYRGYCRARLHEMEKHFLQRHRPPALSYVDREIVSPAVPVTEPSRDVSRSVHGGKHNKVDAPKG